MRSTATPFTFDNAQVAAQRVAAQSVVARLRRDDGSFRLAFGLALLAHALFFLSFLSAPTRQLGDPGGVDGAVSIEMTTEADLRALGTVSDSAGQPLKPTIDAAEPAPPMEIPPLFPQPSQSQQQAQPTEQRPIEQRAPEQRQADLAKLPEPQKAEAKQPEAKQAEAQQPAPKTEFTPQDFDLPGLVLPEAEKKEPDKKKAQPPQKQPPQKQAMLPQEQKQPQPKPTPISPPKLDLSLPQSAFERPTFTANSGSGSAGMERPAGITRSGENDDFARNVVRALQRTMPQLSNTRGNVTVRIILDDRGNLVSTVVTRRSNIDGLDQSVVFATKQSSFPIPPRNHVQADLVFVVTYLYR